MVDVVFVLMIFFMACAFMQKSNLELAAQMPGRSVGTPPTAIFVDISPDGLVSANNQVLGQPGDRQLHELRSWFTNIVETFGDQDPVIIRPSPATRHERIIEVLGCASAAHVQKVSFN